LPIVLINIYNDLLSACNVPRLDEWDPLQDAPTAPEIISSSKKRTVKNILKSYTGWFDPFSELIQNALDAVDRRAEISDPAYTPTIWIDIDLKNNSLRIMDNGVGFDEDKLFYFLAPDISFKDKQKTRGNKGVGATYLTYGFNHLEIGTKCEGFDFYGIIKNGRTWVEDEQNALPRPTVKRVEIPAFLSTIDRGSVFTLRFVGDYIRPSNLTWIQADNAEKWEAVLRLMTPLGGIYVGVNPPRTKCIIEVIDPQGGITERTLESCNYLYPHLAFKSSGKLSEIQEIRRQLLDKGRDPYEDLPGKYKQLSGIYEIWDAKSILEKKTAFNSSLSDDEKRIMKEQEVVIYGFFSYSTRIWDHFNYEHLGLRRSNGVLKGGLQLATKNMAQGSLITIPLTSSIGYQKTSLVMVHYKDADTDLGRKGFQPEMTELAKNIAISVVNYLKRWNDLLKEDEGGPLDLEASKGLHEWIRKQEEHEQQNPLIIKNENFFLPMKKISISSEPWSEQDVIVLFNQLLAGGVIRGIKMLATSQTEKYDAVCRVMITKPVANHQYDPITNPLGIKQPEVREGVSEPWVLEYKHNLDRLIEEFGKEEKYEKDINIVVCWDIGSKWKEHYTVVPLLHEDYIHHRKFHGVTHEVKIPKSDTPIFYLIVLSELIQRLNDPQQSHDYQEQTYLQLED